MLPEQLSGERRVRIGRVPDEAASGVGVHGKQKGNEEMMRVPERLKRLLAYPSMGGGVHQKHAQEHDMTGDAASLSVVHLDRRHRAKLCPLDIEEAARSHQQPNTTRQQRSTHLT